jgi:hypothetical protein
VRADELVASDLVYPHRVGETCARASRQGRSGSSWSLRRDRHAGVSVNAPLSPKKFTTGPLRSIPPFPSLRLRRPSAPPQGGGGVEIRGDPAA